MLTLRVIPPRLLPFGAAPTAQPSHDLARLYFDGLWRHWGLADRAVALALAGAALTRGLAVAPRAAWRHGWDGDEQALLLGEADPDAHLGMAARKGLHRLINPGAYPLDRNPLKNKRLFAERCRAAGLPVPDDFCGSTEALPAWMATQDAIIAKPNYASKGSGVEGFRRDGGGWASAGVALTQAEVVRKLGAALAAGAVVQRACAAHPALLSLSPGALPTLRVMTAVNEAGAPEACDRVIRLSAGGPRPVDNFNAQNIVAGIDAGGRIGRGYRRVGGKVVTLDRHPATSEALVGRPVPDLEAAIDLALRAHAVFKDGFRVIGWDVGLTDGGPVLIEGNWNPGTDILRLVAGTGLGDGRLGALYRHHLSQASADDWRRARPIQREPRRARG